jgi:predicted RNA-binding protein YlqC (UPF0109 family)
MAETFVDQEFVEHVVRSIVGNPDDVKTERTIDERGVLITLHVNPDDMGYVIGRQGQTARAIRTLLKIVGAKSDARVNLKVFEPEGSRRPPRRDDRRDERRDERREDAPAEETPTEEIDTSAVDLEI